MSRQSYRDHILAIGLIYWIVPDIYFIFTPGAAKYDTFDSHILYIIISLSCIMNHKSQISGITVSENGHWQYADSWPYDDRVKLQISLRFVKADQQLHCPLNSGTYWSHCTDRRVVLELQRLHMTWSFWRHRWQLAHAISFRSACESTQSDLWSQNSGLCSISWDCLVVQLNLELHYLFYVISPSSLIYP